MTGIGDNSDASGIAAGELRQGIERIERLEEEIKALNEDKSEVYKEFKARGFDTKVMKQIVSLRRVDHATRMENEAILDLYKQALGIV